MEVKYDKTAVLEYIANFRNLQDLMRRDMDESLNMYNVCKQEYSRIFAECEEERRRVYNRVMSAEREIQMADMMMKQAMASMSESDGENSHLDYAMINRAQEMRRQAEADLVVAQADYSRAQDNIGKLKAVMEKYGSELETESKVVNDSFTECSIVGSKAGEALEQYVGVMDKAYSALYGGTPSQSILGSSGSSSANGSGNNSSGVGSLLVGDTTAGVVSYMIAGKKREFVNSKAGLNQAYKAAIKANDKATAQEIRNAFDNFGETQQSIGINNNAINVSPNSSGVVTRTQNNQKMNKKVRSIIKDTFAKARELTFKASEGKLNGRFFTDHKEKHVEMVAVKSLEAGQAIQKAIELGGISETQGSDRIHFSSQIDMDVLEGAGLSHDTGMCGNGYRLVNNGNNLYSVEKLNSNNFDEVRENHSLNSAINVLINRQNYLEAGYSDEQIVKMAVECMAHSKSSSRVTDLNSRTQWGDCFDRIDATVEQYNNDHKDAKISFDRSIFEKNEDLFSSLATETLALRIGDVSRDSYAGAESQSGENVYVDKALLGKGGSWANEIGNVKSVTIGEKHDIIDSDFSRRVHAGEQNIAENHTYADDNGNIIHIINISDGNVAPLCTQEAIREHIGELATASEGNFIVQIEFSTPCDNESKKLYRTFARSVMGDGEIDGISNIKIRFQWNK